MLETIGQKYGCHEVARSATDFADSAKKLLLVESILRLSNNLLVPADKIFLSNFAGLLSAAAREAMGNSKKISSLSLVAYLAIT